ncbi:MAG: 30S ribosomal protein S20 [Deltaproteobacteria bacterium]|nr:30S ribosomal protein S20 [Deltaproteobacteria bacterium]
MANLKSALKRNKQSEVRRLRNKINKTKVKNVVKNAKLASTGPAEVSAASLRLAESTIRKVATKGTLHKRTASRKISRLARYVYLGQKEVAKAQASVAASGE